MLYLIALLLPFKSIFENKLPSRNYSSSPISAEDTSQDPQWMLETMDMVKLVFILCFPYAYDKVSLEALIKEPTCQCRRHGRPALDPWVRKIPWRRTWQSTPVFLPGKFQEPGGLQSKGQQRDMTEVTRHTHDKVYIHTCDI